MFSQSILTDFNCNTTLKARCSRTFAHNSTIANNAWWKSVERNAILMFLKNRIAWKTGDCAIFIWKMLYFHHVSTKLPTALWILSYWNYLFSAMAFKLSQYFKFKLTSKIYSFFLFCLYTLLFKKNYLISIFSNLIIKFKVNVQNTL